MSPTSTPTGNQSNLPSGEESQNNVPFANRGESSANLGRSTKRRRRCARETNLADPPAAPSYSPGLADDPTANTMTHNTRLAPRSLPRSTEPPPDSTPPPAPNSAPLSPAAMQFTGSFKGATWNTQALFARRSERQHCKRRHAMKLIQSYDFVGLQETHSTDGAVKAMSMPTGIRPFWSHGSTRKAGIGLLVKEQFLLNFNAVTDDSWEEVEPGRAAVLRLRGPQGALDIFVLYHHTGASTQAKSSRSSTRAFLSTAIQPQAEVLSILMGDFNYVAHHRDRFNKANNNGVESSDGTEESSFRRVLGEPFDLCELQQEEYTHDSALGRSRLDRVYSNHHLSDQLDRRIGCVALNWVPWFSAHRPLVFFDRLAPRIRRPTLTCQWRQ